jgi:hypothetical protein
MAEVSLIRTDGVTADSFVQVKVGSMKKQVSVREKRALRFPTYDNIVEVEVMSTVARCRVNLQPEQEVYRVALGDMSVDLNVKETTSDFVPPPKTPGSPNSKRLCQALTAREYLEEHWEAIHTIQNMLQTVIHEKPDDPLGFFANYFTKIIAPDKEKVAREEVTKVEEYALAQKAEMEKVRETLYEKERRLFHLEKENYELKKPDPTPTPFTMRPSVGTWLRVLDDPLPEPEPPEAPAPFFCKPSTGSLMNSLPLKLKPVPKPPARPETKFCPSTVAHTPPMIVQPVIPKEEEYDAPLPAFKWRPSVSTWMAPLPIEKTPHECEVEAEIIREAEEHAKREAEELKRRTGWPYKPSCATWLQRPKPDPVRAVARENKRIADENAALKAQIEALRKDMPPPEEAIDMAAPPQTSGPTLVMSNAIRMGPVGGGFGGLMIL